MAPRPHVGLLHYSAPPIIGGVEAILYEQARRLSERGYPVTIIAGRGGPLVLSEIRLVIIPEVDSRNARVMELREQFDKGIVPAGFIGFRDEISALLESALVEIDTLIVHNVLTMHFNLPLTAALWSIAKHSRPRIIAWTHDLSWVNPLYKAWMHPGEPWDLLRRANPRIHPVFVSRQRMREWKELTGAPLDEANVIPNGVDAVALLRLNSASRAIAHRFGLLEAEVVLLAPVRITRRKNLEWAIQAAAAVRSAGKRVHLLVTGPPGPHDPRSMDYLAELKDLARSLGVEDAVHFLFEALSPLGIAGAVPETASEAASYAIDTETLSDLYMLSDVVVMPSASEGFGLPLAEAAIFRTPVVCTDLPAFSEVAPQGAIVVPLSGGSPAFSTGVLAALDSPAARLRRHVLDSMSWDRLINDRIEPLLA